MRILFFTLLTLTLSLHALAQPKCEAIFHALSLERPVERPVSNSPKGEPGTKLTAKNLKREAEIFEWYIDSIGQNHLPQALDIYKGSSFRQINGILRAENPDFTKTSAEALEAEYQKIDEATRRNKKFDRDGKKERRIYFLQNAFTIEREIFPLGYKLDKGIVLYRAVAFQAEQIPNAGEIFYDHAFMSTSVKYADQNFSGDTARLQQMSQYLEVEFRITNRGFQGNVLPGVGKEHEIILPRNAPLRIVSVKKRGQHVLVEADLVDPSDL